MPEVGAAPGTLIGLAPAAGEIGHLLRTAIDAEQVGATLLHLPVDQPDLAAAVSGLREHTDLVLVCDHAVPGLDRVSSGFERVVVPAGDDLPTVVRHVAQLVAEHPAGVGITGRGHSSLTVLLATLAAGGHVLVDPPEPDGRSGGAPARDHVALVARASGLARIAGRPPLDRRAARALLGVE